MFRRKLSKKKPQKDFPENYRQVSTKIFELNKKNRSRNNVGKCIRDAARAIETFRHN